MFLSAGAGVKTNLVFFTKGKPTERIWYFDLSDVKVTRKSPLTVRPFAERGFFDLLKTKGDGPFSWSIDFGARRDAALAAREPLDEQAATIREQLEEVETELRQKTKAKAARDVTDALRVQIATLERQARELEAKAQAIEFVIYNIKAVNPNRPSDEDTRTPTELLTTIEARGLEAEAALTELKALLAAEA